MTNVIGPKCLAWLLCLILLGCGSSDGLKMGTVTGTITVDANPAPNLDVVFQPETGRPSTGTTDSSGRYELQYSTSKSGALVGRHLVMIAATPRGDASATDPAAKAMHSIPSKYNTNSELSAEVKPGKNKFDFELFSH